MCWTPVTTPMGRGVMQWQITDPVDLGLENVIPGEGGVFNPTTRIITWTAATTPANSVPRTVSFGLRHPVKARRMKGFAAR